LAAPASPAVGIAPPRIHRFTGHARVQVDAVPASVERVLSSPGSRLNPALQQEMEQRFGHDFSRVQVHSGAAAEQSAREVNAHAYTVGNNIVFRAGRFTPETNSGRRLLAHELAHVVQQGGGNSGDTVRREVDPSQSKGADPELARIESRLSYSLTDWEITDADATEALRLLKALSWERQTVFVRTMAKYLERLRDNLPPDRQPELRKIEENIAAIANLKAEETALEPAIAPGSGKSLGEIGGALARLKGVAHDLAVRTTGTGVYEGTHCEVKTPGAIPTDCTTFVIEVLKEVFTKHGRAADWTKIERKYKRNIASRGATEVIGLDIQAALQSEAGWKGIYWAPDPQYLVPKQELGDYDPKHPLKGVKPEEASYTSTLAKKKGTYYKTKSYPGVSISQSVTNFAPEKPNEPRKAGYPGPSTTTKTTEQLEKLKRLPFGILSALGGFHMTIISYGKVIEAHWRARADYIGLVEETDVEKWGLGPNSGYHAYTSGAIVAPADDVDAAFK
ncbi:MAG: hypothetical protein QOF22_1424, partial [Bradyrhizobium sp.]|nr:hypothetical protein [Bradyrhizobium sp.]